MMQAAQVSKSKYGNSFTYTLIDQKDTTKFQRNIALVGVGLVLVGVGLYFYTKKIK